MMSTQELNATKVLRLVVWCIALSAMAAVAFLVGGHTPSVHGPSGGVGFMAALIGSGVAFWFSLRARDARLIVAALLSLFPLAFWCWQIYEIVHG
jgi:hypothetical protein